MKDIEGQKNCIFVLNYLRSDKSDVKLFIIFPRENGVWIFILFPVLKMIIMCWRRKGKEESA